MLENMYFDSKGVPFDDLDNPSPINLSKPSFNLTYGTWQNSLTFRYFSIGEYTEGTNYAGDFGYCDNLDKDEQEGLIYKTAGDLWSADVTAFSINGRRLQTDATLGYIDSMQKYTFVPDAVFDAFLDYVEETLVFTPEWVPTLNSYVWPA
jgi:hypothetical protein